LVIADWLSDPLNFEQKQKDAFNLRHKHTGEWLLREKPFTDWISETGMTLWCRGIRTAYFFKNLIPSVTD